MYLKNKNKKQKKSTIKFGKCTNLTPRFCGTFQIFVWIGPMAHHLVLATHIKVHNISPTAKIDVIEEYIQILDEGQMKMHALSDLSKRR